MRILGQKEPNTLIIHDKISGEDLTLFYRIPTTKERVDFSAKILKRNKKGKYELDLEYKLSAGASILTDIPDGQFGDEKGNPISSDPKSENYRPDWKELIKNNAPELIAILADFVFDNARVVDTQELIEDDIEEEEKELPLQNCSSSTLTNVLMSENKSV